VKEKETILKKERGCKNEKAEKAKQGLSESAGQKRLNEFGKTWS